MTTVVNNPVPVKESGDSGGGKFLVGIILIIIFLGTIIYFAVPAIKNMQPIQVNVPAPEITVETPEVAIPKVSEVTTEVPETTPTE